MPTKKRLKKEPLQNAAGQRLIMKRMVCILVMTAIAFATACNGGNDCADMEAIARDIWPNSIE